MSHHFDENRHRGQDALKQNKDYGGEDGYCRSELVGVYVNPLLSKSTETEKRKKAYQSIGGVGQIISTRARRTQEPPHEFLKLFIR